MKTTLEFKLCIRNNNPQNLGTPGILHMSLVIFIKPLKDNIVVPILKVKLLSEVICPKTHSSSGGVWSLKHVSAAEALHCLLRHFQLGIRTAHGVRANCC